mgnify:CR=1 FL=1
MNFPIILDEENIEFPLLDNLDNDGLVAISANVKPEYVLRAYKRGIFPWYGELDPVLWWSPNPRCVIIPNKVRITKSMRSILKKNELTFFINRSFNKVIKACSKPRTYETSTWLLPEMIETYNALHKQGFAHSVETYLNDKLVGGFYGLSIGSYFAGESMFSKSSNTSKAALIVFCKYCEEVGIPFIDCQIPNPHLGRMGAEKMKRSLFLDLLQKSINQELPANIWKSKQLVYSFD